MRRAAELDQDFGAFVGQGFAGAEVEGYALPAPVVDVKTEGGVGGGAGIGGYAGLVKVAVILALDGVGGGVLGGNAADGFQDFEFFVAEGVGFKGGGGFHRDDGEDLEQVALEHIAQHAGLVVVGGAFRDGYGFGDGDLDVVDVVAGPEGFKDGVGETEYQQVLDGFFAEIVVDAVDLMLGEYGMDDVVEPAGGFKVGSEGFFDDQAAPAIVFLVVAGLSHSGDGGSK